MICSMTDIGLRSPTIYWVECDSDGCDARGGRVLSEEQAFALAEEEGWLHVDEWIGSTDFCPACLLEADDG